MKYCLYPQARGDRAPLGHLPNQPQLLRWRPKCSSKLWVAVSVKGEGKAYVTSYRRVSSEERASFIAVIIRQAI